MQTTAVIEGNRNQRWAVLHQACQLAAMFHEKGSSCCLIDDVARTGLLIRRLSFMVKWRRSTVLSALCGE